MKNLAVRPKKHYNVSVFPKNGIHLRISEFRKDAFLKLIKRKVQDEDYEKENDFFVACQFHPEFKSRPQNPHPLFDGLIKTVLKQKEE